MYNLTIYRDGDLPAINQEWHVTQPRVLRCSYWAMRAWNHAKLSAPFWRLYWNKRAGATVTWNGERHELNPDHLLLITPNTPFTTHFGPDTDLESEANIMVGSPVTPDLATDSPELVCHFFIHFTLGLPYDGIAPRLLKIPIEDETRQLVESLTHALGADRYHFNHQQSFALNSLIQFALQHVPEAAWPERQMDARVRQVLGYIDEHLQQHLCNQDFGRLARMSPNAFTRLFKQKTGITPLAHLNQRRIERASIMLYHTDQSIEEIAERCGFSDRAYFSRVFKSHFGVGPASYRARRTM